MCKAIVLSSKGATTVTYCTQCSTHYIWQHSYLLTFTTAEYKHFCMDVTDKIGKESYYIFPDAIWRMVLRTPLPELLFTFTDEEWSDFHEALNEASFMQEIHQLLA